MTSFLGVGLLGLLLAFQAAPDSLEPAPATDTRAPEEAGFASGAGQEADAPVPSPPPAPRPPRVSASVPLEQLWKSYVDAEEAGDRERAVRTFAEISRLRTERNIPNQETLGLALVARSLSPGEGLPVPESWHPPITQHALIHRDSPQAGRAAAFLDYLAGPNARPTLDALGYRPCP